MFNFSKNKILDVKLHFLKFILFTMYVNQRSLVLPLHAY